MSSIETEGLTKRFGSLTAVDHLSFKVEGGEVFGLLGPNGAGKTTTIRMLASLISPTEGYALVNGHDVVEESLRVREIVGILTENPRAPACNVIDRSNLIGPATEEDLCLRKAGILLRSGRRPQ